MALIIWCTDINHSEQDDGHGTGKAYPSIINDQGLLV